MCNCAHAKIIYVVVAQSYITSQSVLLFSIYSGIYVYFLYEHLIIFPIFLQRHFINLTKLDTYAKLQTIIISISTQVLRMSSSQIVSKVEKQLLLNNIVQYTPFMVIYLSDITSTIVCVSSIVMQSLELFLEWAITIICIMRWNLKRDFYLDVYTILNRIQSTIWIICAFRALNPHRWSLAKQSNLKSWKVITKKCLNKMEPKGMV